MCAEAGQFAKDHFDIFRHVVAPARIRNVHQMNQKPGAFDVPQELGAQAGTGVRSFDQARNVSNHKADLVSRVADSYHAEIRFEGSERIIRNLWACRRNT